MTNLNKIITASVATVFSLVGFIQQANAGVQDLRIHNNCNLTINANVLYTTREGHAEGFRIRALEDGDFFVPSGLNTYNPNILVYAYSTDGYDWELKGNHYRDFGGARYSFREYSDSSGRYVDAYLCGR